MLKQKSCVPKHASYNLIPVHGPSDSASPIPTILQLSGSHLHTLCLLFTTRCPHPLPWLPLHADLHIYTGSLCLLLWFAQRTPPLESTNLVALWAPSAAFSHRSAGFFPNLRRAECVVPLRWCLHNTINSTGAGELPVFHVHWWCLGLGRCWA